MEPHVQRMHDEIEAIAEKIDKLRSFMGIPDGVAHANYNTLGATDKALLSAQLYAMQTYSGVLAIRISRAS